MSNHCALAQRVAELEARCARLEALLVQSGSQLPAVIPATSPPPADEEWLEPCVIAHRLGLSATHTRRLYSRGHLLGVAGVKKDGGRWFATVDAIRAVWSGQV
jgi:hypothetical protein